MDGIDVPPSGPNPFSFRTFVQAGGPSASSTSSARSSKVFSDAEDAGGAAPADATGEENPFSFKKFVKRDSADALQTESRTPPERKQPRTSSKTSSVEIETPFPEVADPELLKIEIEALRKKNKKSQRALADLEARAAFAEADAERLKTEAAQANERADAAERKVAALERTIKTFRAKEAEDTAALESMVHAIEKNLELTTVRALNAESAADALRAERDKLAARVVAAEEAARDLAARCDASLRALREKSAYASAQLLKVASDGEAAVKSLLQNVETMRLAADVMAAMDKTEPLH